MSNDNSRQAEADLHAILMDAATRLRAFEQEPIAIASANDKFNDAHEDDYWCAVRVGNFMWEQSQFFASPENNFPGYAKEQSRLPMTDNSQGTALLKSEVISELRKLLSSLENQHWRKLVEEAFNVGYGYISAIFVQFDQAWFHVGHPNIGGEKIYAIHKNGIVPVAEHDERMDELIGQPNLILHDKFDQTCLPYLTKDARRQLAPVVQSMPAVSELNRQLNSMANSIRRETSEIVVVNLPPTEWQEQKERIGFRAGSHYGPNFAVDGVFYSQQHIRGLREGPMKEEVRQKRLAEYEFCDFEKIELALRSFEKAGLRGLFENAFGIDTFDDETLDFVLVGSDGFLVHAAKAYSINSKVSKFSQIQSDLGLPPIPGMKSGNPVDFMGYLPMNLHMHSLQESFQGIADRNPKFIDVVGQK